MAAITNHFVVYLDTRVTYVGVYMRAGMWESQGVVIRCLPRWLSILFFERDSSIGSEADCFG